LSIDITSPLGFAWHTHLATLLAILENCFVLLSVTESYINRHVESVAYALERKETEEALLCCS